MDTGVIITDEARVDLSTALTLEEKISEHLKPRERLSWCLSLLATRYLHIKIGTDFAPYSFSWCGWYKDVTERPNIVGGLIYHGESYDEMVTNFTATVEPKTGWSIHT